MYKHSHRQQRTLSRTTCVTGVGFLTGADVLLRFRPAPADTGLVFVRADLPGRPKICAEASMVSNTDRRTTLGKSPKMVTLVEHVLAALHGLRIDNCLIELDAVEPPGLDGSAAGFVEALLDAGIELQSARKTVWAIQRSITVRAGGATLGIHPGNDDNLTISYMLDYGSRTPISRQTHSQVITPGDFAQEIAACRTFVLEEEAKALQATGIGPRSTARDLLVFGPNGVIDNTLRCANEPARHKILDIVGDLALCGLDLRGHIVAYRSGHPLNVELAKAITARHTQISARPARNFFRVAA